MIDLDLFMCKDCTCENYNIKANSPPCLIELRKFYFNTKGEYITMETNELRLCPFCGREARLVDLGTFEPKSRYYVECSGCRVSQGYMYPNPELAISAWNRRFGERGKDFADYRR